MTKQKSPFSKRFLWGVATAAHQVEGNNHNQWSEWEESHARSLAAQAEYHFGELENWDDVKAAAGKAENYISGNSTDHFARYEGDMKALKALGLNAYRFSIEWSRIEPSEGSWDSQAIDHYREMLKTMKRLDIEPMLTLFHFTLPTWFVEKGGFEKRANIKYFVRFAEKAMNELGAGVKYVITINEPEVYASQSYYEGNWPPNLQSSRVGFRVLNNLIRAHKQTAKVLRTSGRRYKISIAKNSAYFYPGDDAWLTRLSARIMQYTQDDYVLKRVVKSCDFIGVNYYFSNRVYGYRIHNPDKQLNDLGWSMEPENLEYVLERLSTKYKKPLIITENGLADASDSKRGWWLQHTIRAMQNALERGADVRGYFHWSLLDNFEWDKGFWPRFGLISVDYENNAKRTARKSALAFRKIITAYQKED